MQSRNQRDWGAVGTGGVVEWWMAWKFPRQAWPFPHADLAAQETNHGDATPASSCVLLPQELGVWAGMGLEGLGACCGGRETAPGMKAV